mmetsp:Transcript_30520/g.97552  ORF Transcript_30520/g.97552 Transcript_30520/m.97552 type:complete len:299 (-) Transcript_30520:162-1058(-)
MGGITCHRRCRPLPKPRAPPLGAQQLDGGDSGARAGSWGGAAVPVSQAEVARVGRERHPGLACDPPCHLHLPQPRGLAPQRKPSRRDAGGPLRVGGGRDATPTDSPLPQRKPFELVARHRGLIRVRAPRAEGAEDPLDGGGSAFGVPDAPAAGPHRDDADAAAAQCLGGDSEGAHGSRAVLPDLGAAARQLCSPGPHRDVRHRGACGAPPRHPRGHRRGRIHGGGAGVTIRVEERSRRGDPQARRLCNPRPASREEAAASHHDGRRAQAPQPAPLQASTARQGAAGPLGPWLALWDAV